MHARKPNIRSLCLCLTTFAVFVSVASFSLWATGADDLFVLPGESAPKPKVRKKPKARFFSGPKLPPIYGPRKEWQSFRSTAQITCTVRALGSLWGGTIGSGLVRWDLRTGGYRFYVPREKSPKARAILSIAASSNGDIWVGTKGFGVAVLKGGRNRWKFYQYKNGLPGNFIQTISIAPNGDVWVGTRRGAARFRKGKWKKFTPRRGLPAADIRAIGVSPSGQVWFSPNASTPFRMVGKKFVKVKQITAIGSNCIVFGKTGAVWMCNDQGAVYYSNGTSKMYTTEHGLTGGPVQTIYLDVSGGTWLGTQQGMSYYRDGRWTRMGLRHGLPGKDIRGIIGSRSGRIFAATHLNGAAKYQSGRWTRLPVGIVGNQIRAIAYSPDNSVWVGTASGASRYYKGYWFNYTNVLPNPDVRAFAFDPEGNVWIGTYGGGVVRFNGKTWKTFEMLDGLASNRVVAAGLTPEGLWFAHEQKGLSRYKNGNWTTYDAKKTRHTIDPAYLIQTLFIDNQYTLWIGSKGAGIATHTLGGSWRRVRQMTGAASKGVVGGITTDSNGTHWFGAKNGLYSLSKKKLKRYTTREGLPDNHVLTLSAEGDKIWLGTRKGVAVFDGTSWRSFTKDAGIADNHVTIIAVTPWGEKWFGTARDGLTIYRGE